jgi:hypothetical protein
MIAKILLANCYDLFLIQDGALYVTWRKAYAPRRITRRQADRLLAAWRTLP